MTRTLLAAIHTRLRRRLRELPRAEEGQSALFAVLTLMLLVIVIAYTYNVGMTVSQRVRLQNAADAAAYSGAVAEANALSAIAWLNNCQTYLHAKLQQHMLDVVMYSTAASIAEWGHYIKHKYDNSKYDDRDPYEPYPFLTPRYFIPIPFVAENEVLEERVFGRMQDLPGAANGYPPAAEFKAVFDAMTFKKPLPETTLQDLADAIKQNLQDIDLGPGDALDNIKQGIKDAFSNATGNLGDSILDAVVTTVKDAISDLFKNLITHLIRGTSPNISIGKIMKNIVKNLVSKLQDALVDAIKGFLGDVFDSISGAAKDYLLGLLTQILDFQKQEYSTFQEVFDDDLYARLNRKYGLSVSDAPSLVKATKEHVLDEAKKWIANPDTGKRPGETWIRQLSLAAAAIAQALPGLVRNEVLYSVSYNAPPDACVAIFPAPALPGAGNPSAASPYASVSGTPPVFDCKPRLAATDADAGGGFFRYDAYDTSGDFVEKNRFLAESRRQALSQGIKYVRRKTKDDDKVAQAERVPGPLGAIIMKPEISYWWDEAGGLVRRDGRIFQGMVRCWNAKDRKIDPDQDEDWGGCPIGYAPGRTPGSPMAKPEDADNAADGHWHVKHGHAHGEDCVRTWGGFCVGLFGPNSLRCFWRCLALEIAGQIHHMQYLNHQATYHWDGLNDADDEGKHVYCEVAVSNRATDKEATPEGDVEFKHQYPDLVPGLRFPRICWMCKFYWFPIVPPFLFLPDCLALHCPLAPLTIPDPPADPPPHHATAGDQWGIFFEYLPLPPFAWPMDNWPEKMDHQHKVFSTGPFAQYFPGHFWTREDWEAFFSGDRYYYSRKHYLDSLDNKTDALTGYGVPDALIGMLPEPLLNVLYLGLEVRGRILNWKSRRGHHGFMVCPLDQGNCPVCKASLGLDWPDAKHFGVDRDGDGQSDVGMTYWHVLGKGGVSSKGHDKVDGGDYAGYDLGTDINYRDGDKDLACDRFVRKTFAPRTDTGTPKPELAPAVIMTNNFFKYGLTVAIWAPHHTYFFRSFFGERAGHLAVATARAGFVEPVDDPDYQPTGTRQIITGVGEARPDKQTWNLALVEQEFLAFRSNRNFRSNLYYPDWGVKLVPTRNAILPESPDNRKRLWRGIGAAYCYTPAGALTGVPLRQKVTHNGSVDDWDNFINDYVDWNK